MLAAFAATAIAVALAIGGALEIHNATDGGRS